MIKTYCDFCGKEITDNNKVKVPVLYTQKRENQKNKVVLIQVEIHKISCGVNDICIDCMFNVITANNNKRIVKDPS